MTLLSGDGEFVDNQVAESTVDDNAGCRFCMKLVAPALH